MGLVGGFCCCGDFVFDFGYFDCVVLELVVENVGVGWMMWGLSWFNIMLLVLGFLFLYLFIVLFVIYFFNESWLVIFWGGFFIKWYVELFWNE